MTESGHEPTDDESTVHGHPGWMMIACCIPMLVIAVALVATGVASAGLLLTAVLCTALMAVMMRVVMTPDRQQTRSQTHRRG